MHLALDRFMSNCQPSFQPHTTVAAALKIARLDIGQVRCMMHS